MARSGVSLVASLRGSLLPLAASVCALLVGVSEGALRTGQIDPLDWLLPCGAGLVALILLESRAGRSMGIGRLLWLIAIMAVPALLFCMLAAATVPWAGLVAFLVGLGLAAFAMFWVSPKSPAGRWSVAAGSTLALGLAGPLAARLDGGGASAGRPTVAFLSGVPLDGAAAASSGGTESLRAVGMRGPLLLALARNFELEPVDRLDGDGLKGVDSLLLVQPRLLAPMELVALDSWVREGGHVVILADPLLYWSDPRPLGAPGRAPLTSLLDPLLKHWGLTLAPARIEGGEPVERRMLSGGRLLQLAGASRFVAAADAPCTLREGGLVAHCRIGRGDAQLVADADWANDALWTLDPAAPGDRRAWTSDAIPMLSHFLRGDSARVLMWRSWLKGPEKLVSGLRWALLALLASLGGAALSQAIPSISQSRRAARRGHKGNIPPPDPKSG